MSWSRVCVALMLPAALALWACSRGPDFVARDEPWRADEERACLGAGLVRESAFVEARASLGGPSVCGALRPFAVAAAARGAVHLRPPALLRCPMVPAVDHWVERVVGPAARHYFGAPVVELKVAASYSCRPRTTCPARASPSTGTPTPSTSRPSCWPTGAWCRSRAAGGVQWPSAPSCARCTAAPATSSPRCWAPPTTPITARSTRCGHRPERLGPELGVEGIADHARCLSQLAADPQRGGEEPREGGGASAAAAGTPSP